MEFLSNLYVLRPLESENCQNRSIFYVFEENFRKKSKIQILFCNGAYKSLLIILIAFLDWAKIRIVTVCKSRKTWQKIFSSDVYFSF